jgi:hypothetical protein
MERDVTEQSHGMKGEIKPVHMVQALLDFFLEVAGEAEAF